GGCETKPNQSSGGIVEHNRLDEQGAGNGPQTSKMPTLTLVNRLPPKGEAEDVPVLPPPSSPSSSSASSSAKENARSDTSSTRRTIARQSAAKTKTEGPDARKGAKVKQQHGERRKSNGERRKSNDLRSFFKSSSATAATTSKKRNSSASASDSKTPKKRKKQRKTPLFVPLNEKSKPILVTAPMIGCEEAAKMTIPLTCLDSRDDLCSSDDPLVIDEIHPFLRDKVDAFLGGFGR
ncbi:hypothetical protein THAOC_18841, partial [Thalassiosira oceanica]